MQNRQIRFFGIKYLALSTNQRTGRNIFGTDSGTDLLSINIHFKYIFTSNVHLAS